MTRVKTTTPISRPKKSNRPQPRRLHLPGWLQAVLLLLFLTQPPHSVTSYGDGSQSVTLTYDANGNRATRLITDSGNTTSDSYTYDYDNRLVNLTESYADAENDDEGAPYVYAYTYDYRTRRIIRDESGAGGSVTALVFSGGTSVQEYDDGATTPSVEYIRGSDYGGGVGGILYTLRSGTPSYTFENKRGDVIAKVNGSGGFSYMAQYEAFGNQVDTNGTTLDRQQSNSKDTDPTGLVDEGFRYRDLDTGAFLTRDPAGFVDGPNEYTYVLENPWTKFDPEGLTTEDIIVGYATGITNGVVIDGINSYKNLLIDSHDFGTYIPDIPHVDNRGSATDKGDYDQGVKGGNVGSVAAMAIPGGQEGAIVKAEGLLAKDSAAVTGVAEKDAGAVASTPKPAESSAPGAQSASSIADQAAAEVSQGTHKAADYSHISDPKNVNASTKPTPRQVREMKKANRAQNSGELKDDVTGETMVDSAKSQKGITPPANEAQVDHVTPVDKGGTRTQSNLLLRTRANNRDKSNN